MAIFELPKLPYDLDALAPEISKETMEYHYGKHHQGYVNTLNNLVKGTKYAEMTLEEIIKDSEGAVFNNAAQVWNHTFFFLGLSPTPKKAPEGALLKAIEKEFGSFDQFIEKFSTATVGRFGSGWGWLVKDGSGKLSIVTTSNAENPMTQGLTPIMCVDVWEHAYYIDYRNVRADFVKVALGKTDWAVIEKRFAE